MWVSGRPQVLTGGSTGEKVCGVPVAENERRSRRYAFIEFLIVTLSVLAAIAGITTGAAVWWALDEGGWATVAGIVSGLGAAAPLAAMAGSLYLLASIDEALRTR